MTFRHSPVYIGLSAALCLAVFFSAAPVVTETTRSVNAVISLDERSESTDNPSLAGQRPTHEFSREWLVNHARELAKEPFVAATIDSNSPLAQLDYDSY